MSKIAFLLTDNLFNRKGLVNAELNRLKYFINKSKNDVDVYSFQVYEGWLVRKLRRTKEYKRANQIDIDGITIRIFWRKFSIIDYILTVKLHLPAIVNRGWGKRYSHFFKDYDIISSHSTECGALALDIFEKYNVPFFVTWHGSDIHTNPFENRSVFSLTKKIIEKAAGNFFVSQALLLLSNNITENGKKILMYNGVDSIFTRFDDRSRLQIREKYNITDKKVVAFAGNLIEVKNPYLLPDIFKTVNSLTDDQIDFWVIGDGKFYHYIEKTCSNYELSVRMFGNQPVSIMPELLNCVDVLVLPSQNEGLPLIIVEALKCGANVVGARVGGIPEVIGEQNTFVHGEEFINQVSKRVVEMLKYTIVQNLDSRFSWEAAAEIEMLSYEDYLK